MSKSLSGWVALLVLAGVRGAAAADVPEDFADTPKGLEIRRGIDASDACAGNVLQKTAQFAPCVLAAADKNRQKGGDPSAFEAGLYFDAWLDLDLLARPDEAPTQEVTRRAAAAARPDAARLVKLYRAAQRRAGVTDDEVILVSQLTDDTLKPRLAVAERAR